MDTKKPFNSRGLTSFIVLLSFVAIAVSGVMLFISPKGRVAHWTGWTMWGLEKGAWESLHLTMAIAFVVGVAFHIYFNWAYLVAYVKNAATKGVRSKRELGLAAATILVVFLGTRMEIPPFSSVVALGDNIKDYWEESGPRVPYAHAEESTVAEFAANTGVSLERVTQRLHEKGFAFEDPETTIGDLAAKYGKTPDELFSEMASETTGGSSGAGRGLGRMTFEQICADAGVNAETARADLHEHGIEVLEGEQMRDIAEKRDMTPVDLLSLITEAGKAASTTTDEVFFETPAHAPEGTSALLPETGRPASGDGLRGQGRGSGERRGYGQGQGRGSGEGRGYGQRQGRGYGGGRSYGQGQGRGRAEGTN